MSESSSAIEIVATASKLFADICDIPVLSPLKPLGNVVTICEHAAVSVVTPQLRNAVQSLTVASQAVKENTEAAILLAERVNHTVHVLTNRARDSDGAMPGNYMHDIQSLERWVD